MRHGDVFLKVFTSLFSKSDRRSNARSVGRRAHAAKSPTRAFLFAKLFLLRFFCQKKKRTNDLKRLYGIRGTPHLCGSPLPSWGSAFTPLWRFGRIREFRPLRRATADRGGSDELLKKLEQNFQTASPCLPYILQFKEQKRRVCLGKRAVLLVIIFQDRRRKRLTVFPIPHR